MTGLLQTFNVFILIYFAVLNGFYLFLSILAFKSLRTYVLRLRSLNIDDLVSSSGGLPVSLIVPAYNEAETIVESVRSLLTLRYSDYEIIVVNDGSRDATLVRLIAAFDLHRIERVATSDVTTEPVRHVYQSSRHPALFVVDKDNGGKADALNAGLNYSRGAIFCAMDADTLLEADALARVARPFLEDASTVAVGGIVRIVNGCEVDGGSIGDIGLPKKVLPRFQVLEYLRAFLASRVGWDRLGATLIISGAFGAFRRSTVGAVGGFDTRSVGEDMELVVRLHRYCRDNAIPYKITFIPDPVAWTEAPEKLSQLAAQRDRWQRGLAQVIVRHRSMIGRRRYGVPGMVALPYFVAFELLGPVVELLGWVAFLTALSLGIVSLAHVVAFLALAVFLGSALSVASVALEEMSFRRYRRSRDLVTLLGLALIESFGYRQISTYWRLRGLVSALRRDGTWGEMERGGFEGVAQGAEARQS
ncbi:MAG: glycosyltransferase family 2 protein [Actinomycetia bacterium]|nr:glycosyltransferase family 2 protein [Actinomycetes bacterium]